MKFIIIIQNVKTWLPIDLINSGLSDRYFSTGRIEGYFGSFKQNYGNSRTKISDLIKALINKNQLCITQSYQSREKTTSSFQGFPLLFQEELHLYGKLLLEILSEEFNCYINKIENNLCVWCRLREIQSPFCIPCRHTMKNGDVYSIDIFHPRYIRHDYCLQSEENKTEIINEQEDIIDHNYSNIMARIQPFASIANRNNEIAGIFDSMISQLESKKSYINNGMPPTLTIKGRSNEHPSKNVLAGRPRSHKKYKCSNCGQYGHNKLTCSKLNKN